MNLTKEQDNMLQANLKYTNVEHCNKAEKMQCNEITKLTFIDYTPVFTKSEEVKNRIIKIFEQVKIRPFTSPWSIPIWYIVIFYKKFSNNLYLITGNNNKH